MKLSLLLSLFVGSATAFSVDKPQTDRRSMLKNGAAALFTGAMVGQLAQPASAITYPAAEGGWKLGSLNSVVGREIRSFNGLIYSFKNTALDGGLDASKLNEPSIPFIEFGKSVDSEFCFLRCICFACVRAASDNRYCISKVRK
jgi:hypothetical protein